MNVNMSYIERNVWLVLDIENEHTQKRVLKYICRLKKSRFELLDLTLNTTGPWSTSPSRFRDDNTAYPRVFPTTKTYVFISVRVHKIRRTIPLFALKPR